MLSVKQPTEHVSRRSVVLRKCIAEVAGTFLLVFFHCSLAITVARTHDIVPIPLDITPISLVGASMAAGLTLVGIIYSHGAISGAHVNPAISIALAIRGSLPWSLLPLYIVSQLAGAFAATGILTALWGRATANMGSNEPHGIDPGRALLLESMLTFFLAVVAVGTTTRGKIVGPQAALAVGAAVALGGIVGGPYGCGSMNPARSLAPAVVSGNRDTLSKLWIYTAGPVLGAVAASVFVSFLAGWREDAVQLHDEVEMACGLGRYPCSAPVHPRPSTVFSGDQEDFYRLDEIEGGGNVASHVGSAYATGDRGLSSAAAADVDREEGGDRQVTGQYPGQIRPQQPAYAYRQQLSRQVINKDGYMSMGVVTTGAGTAAAPSSRPAAGTGVVNAVRDPTTNTIRPLVS